MEPYDVNTFNQRMRFRTRAFAVAVHKILNGTNLGDLNRSLARQLLRSATSVAANYSSATRGRSEAEFYSKMCIVVEECDEALFWLDFLLDADILRPDQIAIIRTEAEELLNIFSTIRKKMKNKRFPNP